MIALKLVFQSLASTAAVGGIAFGSYKFMNADFDDHFLLVSGPTTAPTDSPTLHLWSPQTTAPNSPAQSLPQQSSAILVSDTTASEDSSSTPDTVTPPVPTKTKQYLCEEQSDKKTKDNDCLLYTIKFDDSKKTTDLSKLSSFLSTSTITSDELTKTEDKTALTTNKFFILKTSLVFANSVSKDGKSTIKLMSNSDTDAEKTKSYATLTVHAKLSENNNEGKVNLAIAQVKKQDTTTTSTTTGPTYTCHFQTSVNEKKPCLIVALTDPTPANSIKDINFSAITIPATQAASVELTENKFVLVQWTGETKYSISELKDSTVVFVETTTSDPATTKTTELSIKASVFAIPSSASSLTEVIII